MAGEECFAFKNKAKLGQILIFEHELLQDPFTNTNIKLYVPHDPYNLESNIRYTVVNPLLQKLQ